MVSNICSLGLGGISGYEVSVECFLSGGCRISRKRDTEARRITKGFEE
jgi:hypothetical protein